MELKKTFLYQKHVENGAHLVDFSGWALPLDYASILKEAKVTRAACGLFDASHMGEILVKGTKAKDFLQAFTSNDISLTQKGQLQYNLFLNGQAGIVDDLMIYNLGERFLCVVNASNIDKVYAWLSEKKREEFSGVSPAEVEIIDESPGISLLSLQGPKAAAVVSKIFTKDADNLKYMHFTQPQLENRNIILSRSGYTAEDGFEIYCPNRLAVKLWDMILEQGRDFGLCLCGLGARDVLRIEAGFPLYGHEISDSINPLEASLGWVVKFKKNFIGREKLQSARLSRSRVGFIMKERAVARQGYPVYINGKHTGEVTSGTFSPNLDKFIGMAYVEKEFAKIATPIEIKIRDKFYKAEIADFNFIKHR